jgi:SAM-dependent methyltransferase
MTIRPTDVLGDIHGGRVLDVATGHGGFVGFLVEGLRDYDEIVGVDVAEQDADSFAEACGHAPNVRFELMDPQAMTFDSGSFDTVAVSVSLHHFEDPRPVLAEMLRVLRPGGHLIAAEMYRDRQTPPQMTHVELHHWAAAIDRSQGIVHRETYRRSELVRLLDSLGLEAVRTSDMADTSDDPTDPATIAAHEPIIERQIGRAVSHPDLERDGERIRRRLAEVGIQGATELVFVGRKPA